MSPNGVVVELDLSGENQREWEKSSRAEILRVET